MIEALRLMAEKRISEAIDEGLINVEKWKNKPLPMEDDSHIPPELRMAYKIMKNSGYLPPEVEARKEINQLEDLISQTEDEQKRLRQMKKLEVLVYKLHTSGAGPKDLRIQDDYYQKVVERLSVNDK